MYNDKNDKNDETDRTEVEGFDEPKQPHNANYNQQQYERNQEPQYHEAPPVSNNNQGGYIIVKEERGEAKDGLGEIIVETSTKGLIYRCEVFKEGGLIDAQEIDCRDLETNANRNLMFKKRYEATHYNFKNRYIAEKNFDMKLKDEGAFSQYKGHCKVMTFISNDMIRVMIVVDEVEFDKQEISLNDRMKNNQELLEAKYTTVHKDMVEKYIKSRGFPHNIPWFDNFLKKLPFYKKKPMYAFYFFLGMIFLVLLLIKMFLCSDYIVNKKKGKKRFEYIATYAPYCSSAQERIVNGCNKSHEGLWKTKSNVFTTKTCLSACTDYDFIDEETCTKWQNTMPHTCSDEDAAAGKCVKPVLHNPFTVMPEIELELTQTDFTTIYIKNNTDETLRFKMKDRRIIGNKNSEIILFANGKTEVNLDAHETDSFRMRLEHTYIGSFASGTYHGEVLFSVFNDDKSVDTTVIRKIRFTID